MTQTSREVVGELDRAGYGRGPRTDEAPLVVVQCPYSADNHYQDLLAKGLAACGVETRFVAPEALPFGWTLRGIDAVHLQWLDSFVQPWRSRRKRVARKFRLAACVTSCRVLGTPLVWTLHNTQPHAGDPRSFSRWSRWLAHNARVVVVHPGAAEPAATQIAGADKVLTLPMGPYRDAIHPADRATARSDWEVPEDEPLIVSFGHIRPQKGIGDLIAAMPKLGAARFSLVVAGKAPPGELASDLALATRRDPRIRWIDRWLDDGELGALLSAADAVVMPVRSGTTSSSAQVAAEFGLALIGPDIPALSVYGRAEFLYDPDLPNALAETLSLFVREWSASDRREELSPPPWQEAVADLVPFYRKAPRRAGQPIPRWLRDSFAKMGASGLAASADRRRPTECRSRTDAQLAESTDRAVTFDVDSGDPQAEDTG